MMRDARTWTRRAGLTTGLAVALLSAGCKSREEPQQPRAEERQAVVTPSVPTTPQAPSTPGEQPQVRIVEASKVCMVNNQYMGTEQLRVDVEGKTYFGCCEMCRDRLNQDATARFAVDPVSGKQVDKATAVIAALPSGQVRYFASVETAQRFISR